MARRGSCAGKCSAASRNGSDPTRALSRTLLHGRRSLPLHGARDPPEPLPRALERLPHEGPARRNGHHVRARPEEAASPPPPSIEHALLLLPCLLRRVRSSHIVNVTGDYEPDPSVGRVSYVPRRRSAGEQGYEAAPSLGPRNPPARPPRRLYRPMEDMEAFDPSPLLPEIVDFIRTRGEGGVADATTVRIVVGLVVLLLLVHARVLALFPQSPPPSPQTRFFRTTPRTTRSTSTATVRVSAGLRGRRRVAPSPRSLLLSPAPRSPSSGDRQPGFRAARPSSSPTSCATTT